MIFRSLVFKLIIFLMPMTSYAIEAHEKIYQQVETFLNEELTNLVETANYSRYEISIGKLDPRLHLNECLQPFELKLLSDPSKSSRNTVKVSCPQDWNIIVTSKIQIFQSVVVASQTINRQTHLLPNLFTKEDWPINKLRYGFFRDSSELENRVSKRNINQGDVVTPFLVEGAELIQRGDNVVIVATSDILKVKMTGTAMSDGKYGQQILIKNNSSSRMVKGIVMERGVVEIPL